MSQPEPDKKYWRKWYWGLMLFLLAQILLYAWITNLYQS